MKIPPPHSRKRARIEIVPLIDVVFFLLATFVMVSLSMVKNLSVPVNLPVASSSTPEKRDTAVTVSVTKDGEIYLNKDLVSVMQLNQKLKSMTADNPDIKVFINGDEEADFGRAILVLDEIRKLGISKVAIQTKSKK